MVLLVGTFCSYKGESLQDEWKYQAAAKFKFVAQPDVQTRKFLRRSRQRVSLPASDTLLPGISRIRWGSNATQIAQVPDISFEMWYYHFGTLRTNEFALYDVG